MPKQRQVLSKGKKISPLIENQKTEIETKSEPKFNSTERIYKCSCCGYISRTTELFVLGYSKLNIGNDYYFPYCKNCLNKKYLDYLKALGNEGKAIKKVCSQIDAYYSEIEVENTLKRCRSSYNEMVFYLNKINTALYTGRTYETTLKEEEDAEIVADAPKKVTNKAINARKKFWGIGYNDNEYEWLQERYDEWITRNECQSMGQETIFKTICLIELQISKELQLGHKVDGLYKQLNDFMGSANIKPSQKNENTFAEGQCFGTLVEKWERTKPIPESEPSDIAKYISIYFLGHLCKMLNIKNEWSDAYEKELDKYTCKPPTYDDIDAHEMSGLTFEDIFGSDNG